MAYTVTPADPVTKSFLIDDGAGNTGSINVTNQPDTTEKAEFFLNGASKGSVTLPTEAAIKEIFGGLSAAL